MKPVWQVGVARRAINPQPGVELAGLGYYLNRTWERVRDNLNSTALVITDTQRQSVAFVALDLMYNDADFTRKIREQVAAQTLFSADAVCVNCSHSHNAPTAGFIRGAGERNEAYLNFAAHEAASAVIEAWKNRQPAKLSVSKGELTGMTFNRTRENGPVDSRVSVLRADTLLGKPLAVAVNFHSHCTAHMEIDLRAVSRDWPGEVVDQIEAALPGATALYLQGTAGDVNFRREFNGTKKRFEPAKAVTKVILDSFSKLQPVEASGVAAVTKTISLPTRRWTREEITRDREEGLHRLKTGDTTDWLDGIAKVCVNQPERLPLRYGGSVEKAVAAVSRFAVEWTDEILRRGGWGERTREPLLQRPTAREYARPTVETIEHALAKLPETLETEVQAIRIGDVYFAAQPAELFTSLGLDLRRCWAHDDLFMLGYSNGSIGYLPDAHDIEKKSYAAIQSPKFTGQFPFTKNSGPAMVEGLLRALEQVKRGH